MKRDMQNKIVGRNSVLALLQNPDSNVEQVLIAEETNHNRLRHIQAVARKKKIRVNHVPRRELDQIASEIPHQGVIAITQPTHYATLNEILNQTKDPKPKISNQRYQTKATKPNHHPAVEPKPSQTA